MITPHPPHRRLVPPDGADLHWLDMTATFDAGVSLAKAQALLAERGQWLAVDGDEGSALGGLVEANSTGPLRLGYGAWRDILLGMQFTNGMGELITAGGRVMKNVAGYDLVKFMVGQRGVFGAIETLTMRTYRRPAGALHVVTARDDGLVGRLIPTASRPQWAVITRESLHLGYLGDAATLDFHRKAVGGAAGKEPTEATMEEDTALRARLWRTAAPEGADQAGFRMAAPPAAIGGAMDRLGAESWSADAAFGVGVGRIGKGKIEAARKIAAEAGGCVQFTFADGRMDFTIEPAQRALLESLKRAFDPDNRLTPLPAP